MQQRVVLTLKIQQIRSPTLLLNKHPTRPHHHFISSCIIALVFQHTPVQRSQQTRAQHPSAVLESHTIGTLYIIQLSCTAPITFRPGRIFDLAGVNGNCLATIRSRVSCQGLGDGTTVCFERIALQLARPSMQYMRTATIYSFTIRRALQQS